MRRFTHLYYVDNRCTLGGCGASVASRRVVNNGDSESMQICNIIWVNGTLLQMVVVGRTQFHRNKYQTISPVGCVHHVYLVVVVVVSTGVPAVATECWRIRKVETKIKIPELGDFGSLLYGNFWALGGGRNAWNFVREHKKNVLPFTNCIFYYHNL